MTAVAFAGPSRWPLRIAQATLAGWLVFFLVTPTIGIGWIDSWHNEQRAVQIVLLGGSALALLALAMSDPMAFRFRKAPSLMAACFLGLGLLSASRSGHVLAAFAEVSLAVLLAALALLTATVTARSPQRSAAWARYFALLFCAAYVLGVGVRLFAALELGRTVDLDVLLLGYANPRFPSAFHVALIPFVALVALDGAESRWLRAAAVVILTALWGINWGLATRGIWFAYLLALPSLVLLVGWRRIRPYAVVLALTAVVGVVCFEILLHVSAPPDSGAAAVAVRPTSNTTLTSRDALWRLSWDAIKASPLLGIGPMQFASLGSLVGAHPHNWVLQAGAEWGLPAMLMLLALAALFTARMRSQATEAGIAMSCSILAAAALALVDGNLVMPITQSAFAIVIGLSVGCSRTAGTGERVAFGVPLAIAALAAFVCLGTYAVSSFSTQEDGRVEFQRSHPGVWLLPRFWEHGLI